LNGVLIGVDEETGRATSIVRLSCSLDDLERMANESQVE
jgi:calcineurin-like phosphoesterase